MGSACTKNDAAGTDAAGRSSSLDAPAKPSLCSIKHVPLSDFGLLGPTLRSLLFSPDIASECPEYSTLAEALDDPSVVTTLIDQAYHKMTVASGSSPASRRHGNMNSYDDDDDDEEDDETLKLRFIRGRIVDEKAFHTALDLLTLKLLETNLARDKCRLSAYLGEVEVPVLWEREEIIARRKSSVSRGNSSPTKRTSSSSSLPNIVADADAELYTTRHRVNVCKFKTMRQLLETVSRLVATLNVLLADFASILHYFGRRGVSITQIATKAEHAFFRLLRSAKRWGADCESTAERKVKYGMAVSNGLKLLHLLLGGLQETSCEQTAVLYKIAHVGTLGSIVSILSSYGCCNPSLGMESVSRYLVQLDVLAKVLRLCGALCPRHQSDSSADSSPVKGARTGGTSTRRQMLADTGNNDDDDEDDEDKAMQRVFTDLMMQLPLYSIGEEGTLTLWYAACALKGQRKCVLSPLLRNGILSSTMLCLVEARPPGFLPAVPVGSPNNSDYSPARRSSNLNSTSGGEWHTAKMFPVFAKEGFGLEGGEGHGPRKELFDSLAEACTQRHCPPLDVTDLAELSVAGRGTTLAFTWLDMNYVQLAAGDKIEFVRSGGLLKSGSGTAINSRNGSSVCQSFTIIRVVQSDLSNSGNSMKLVLNGQLSDAITMLDGGGGLGRNGWLVMIHKAQTPIFVHEKGKVHAWMNPNLPPDPRTTQRGQDLLNTAYMLGYMLANSVANGAPFPLALPPLFCRLLKFFAKELARCHQTSHGARNSSPVPMRVATPEKQASGRSGSPSVGAIRLSRDDLDLIKEPTAKESIEQINAMSANDFKGLVEAEGHDSSMTKAVYIQTVLIEELILGPNRDNVPYWDAIFQGFCDTRIHNFVAFDSCSYSALRSLLFGEADDPNKDFTLEEQFSVSYGDEMMKYDHSHAFRDTFLEVVDSEFSVEEKRKFIFFVTGRSMLPPRPKTDHIHVQFPFQATTKRQYDKQLQRLPSAHSCDNVLELPDYMSALLFSSEGYYDTSASAAGSSSSPKAKEAQRRSCWCELPVETRNEIVADLKELLTTKLRTAISGTDTYELDEGIATNAELVSTLEDRWSGLNASSNPLA